MENQIFAQFWNYLLQALPLAVLLLWAFVRLERRLTTMETDISWIRGNCIKCPQPSEKSSP